ncbi:MAG: Asp-tRNA(Asn)/Glu-tRNA(Gln) amidotransferase subunit GatB [Candidatus Marsarchaeota archaeon]|nr:Asp-tRNA(Asn)/Glu-tRNA(Gln) amidotransferase subunit GatB [Candidatus Marsarchaeota archaeon]
MIGLEVHCQLNTESKLFCQCEAYLSDAKPNESTCEVCLGYPGAKPVLNKRAVDHVISIGLALGCAINSETYFSRKTYFYPDMPKNFQITQYEVPIAMGGKIDVNGSAIRIRRVHLEEDPARIIYANGNLETTSYVLVDYNRAGVPLAEIVTEPDIKSPREARAFLDKLSTILDYLKVYDQARGASIRVDANISIEGGERAEIKNITGFESVEKALNYEIVRQQNLLRLGRKIERETRHFDEIAKTTSPLRKKEFEEDYGYIFDPDLPVLGLSEEWIAGIRGSMPELPDSMVERLARDYSISRYDAKVIVYTGSDFAAFFEETCRLHGKPLAVSRWMTNYLLKSLNWRSERISQSKVRPDTFAELLGLMDRGSIGERYAKELIKEYVDTGASPSELARSAGEPLTPEELERTVKNVVSENSTAAAELREGKEAAMQYLIGLVLSKTKKRGDPREIAKLIRNALGMPL